MLRIYPCIGCGTNDSKRKLLESGYHSECQPEDIKYRQKKPWELRKAYYSYNYEPCLICGTVICGDSITKLGYHNQCGPCQKCKKYRCRLAGVDNCICD